MTASFAKTSPTNKSLYDGLPYLPQSNNNEKKEKDHDCVILFNANPILVLAYA
jgi:hypothetical protein